MFWSMFQFQVDAPTLVRKPEIGLKATEKTLKTRPRFFVITYQLVNTNLKLSWYQGIRDITPLTRQRLNLCTFQHSTLITHLKKYPSNDLKGRQIKEKK